MIHTHPYIHLHSCIHLHSSCYLPVTGVNGSHSPHSSHTANCHSPSSTSANTMAQQLPPACGARQLSKLKRFLTTLQQFGMDISPEIGEHVRSLVLALVVSRTVAWSESSSVASVLQSSWLAT